MSSTKIADLHISDEHFLDLHEQSLLDKKPDESFQLFVNHTSGTAQCQIFRRPAKVASNPNLYEYLTIGTWSGLDPELLFLATLDHEYRKTWDETVAQCEVIDSHRPGDEHSPTDLIYWVTKCPFPLSNRDFVYCRRGVVVGDDFYVVSRHAEHSSKPVKSSPVRVTPMTMAMVMRGVGSDTRFAILYSDDFGGSIPTAILNMAASKVIPSGIEQTYAKAKLYPADRTPKQRALHTSKLAPRSRSASTASTATAAEAEADTSAAADAQLAPQ
jgi:hypothetical protein